MEAHPPLQLNILVQACEFATIATICQRTAWQATGRSGCWTTFTGRTPVSQPIPPFQSWLKESVRTLHAD